jgi:hypothetical protein
MSRFLINNTPFLAVATMSEGYDVWLHPGERAVLDPIDSLKGNLHIVHVPGSGVVLRADGKPADGPGTRPYVNLM